MLKCNGCGQVSSSLYKKEGSDESFCFCGSSSWTIVEEKLKTFPILVSPSQKSAYESATSLQSPEKPVT